MAAKVNPDKVKNDADMICRVWKKKPTVQFGDDLTLQAFDTNTNNLAELIAQIAEKESELSELRNKRDDLAVKHSENCSRAKSGIRAYFGPDSSEYEQAGGTRKSEKKKPSANKKEETAK